MAKLPEFCRSRNQISGIDSSARQVPNRKLHTFLFSRRNPSSVSEKAAVKQAQQPAMSKTGGLASAQRLHARTGCLGSKAWRIS
jgi:hypothetical protein